LWTIKNIYESDFGCEERMPGEPLTVIVILESDSGEICQVEVSDEWLTFQELQEGDEWPLDIEDKGLEEKAEKQSAWMNNYFDAIEEMDET